MSAKYIITGLAASYAVAYASDVLVAQISHPSCTSHFDAVRTLFFSGVNIVQPLIDLIHLDLSVGLSTSEVLIYDYLSL